MKPRHLALNLLYANHKEGVTLQEALSQHEGDVPPIVKELAWGTLRYKLQLEALLRKLNENKPLRIKLRCKLIGYMAIYQHLYMDDTPTYAIVNESVELAKKVCKQQVSFLNALLRKLDTVKLEGLTPFEEVSMPPFLYDKLEGTFDLKQTLSRPRIMLRSTKEKDLPLIHDFEFCKVYEVKGNVEPHLGQEGYVQNITPIELMQNLYDPTFEPLHILDLCAAPGGKLTLANLLFPTAQLFANDLNTTRLSQNIERLKLDVAVREGDGASYPDEQKFDLILLDLPCSGTGVLTKKPEAKYRLNDIELTRLQKLQHELMAHATTLLAPGGQLWIMTCSVLPEENQALLDFAKAAKLCVSLERAIYPDDNGHDGGFAFKAMQ